MNSDQAARAPIAKTVRRKSGEAPTAAMPSDNQKDTVLLSIAKRKSLPHSIADRISGNVFHYRNWYYPGGREAFEQDDRLRLVDKMYPFAEGGQLLVDEPTYPYQIENCERKRAVLKKLGFRYVIIRPGQTLQQVIEEFLYELDNGG